MNLAHPLIRYHGGKFRLSSWIISHFPTHETYVEPFGGGASVLLAKEPSRCEVYNDLDDDVVNLFRVLRNPSQAAQLSAAVEMTPYSRTEFFDAYVPTDDPVERARRLIVRAQFGFGSAGATKGRTGFRLDTARMGSDIVTIWNRCPQIIQQAAERFKGVLVENRDALQIIKDHNRPDTLFFVDPPYVHDTRKTGGKAYRHEMTDAQHEELLTLLVVSKAKVILCGYSHPIYDEALSSWHRVTQEVRAAGRSGSVMRTEVLWMNYQPSEQLDIFWEGQHHGDE